MADVALPALGAPLFPHSAQPGVAVASREGSGSSAVPRAAAAAHSPLPAIACTRSTGCCCTDCDLSSAGAPQLPPVALGRTQNFGSPRGAKGRRRAGPAPMLAGAGGARRRRRQVQQKRRQNQDSQRDDESPDPWQQPAPPRQQGGPVDKMALLRSRGRRPRAIKVARPPAATATDVQSSKPMWLEVQDDQRAKPAESSPETDDQRGSTPHLNLAQCTGCSRRFKPDRLARHEATCQGKKGKRVAFDSKSRALPKEALQASISRRRSTSGSSSEDSTDGASPPGTQERGGGQRKHPKKKKAKWKQQHEEFQAMLRSSGSVRDSRSAGKGGGQSSARGAESAEPAEVYDDRVCCPHCNRKFNEEVASRHIPRCADIKAKPSKMLKKGGGISASAVGAGTSAERQNQSNRGDRPLARRTKGRSKSGAQ